MSEEQDLLQQTEKVSPPSPTTAPAGGGITFGGAVGIAVMASVITAGAMLVCYDHFVARKFVSVDVKGYVDKQQELFVSGKLTEEQLRQNYANLRAIVATIPSNRVVLMGDAVLGGVEKLDLSAAGQK